MSPEEKNGAASEGVVGGYAACVGRVHGQFDGDRLIGTYNLELSLSEAYDFEIFVPKSTAAHFHSVGLSSSGAEFAAATVDTTNSQKSSRLSFLSSQILLFVDVLSHSKGTRTNIVFCDGSKAIL